jgi:hypothetical protein
MCHVHTVRDIATPPTRSFMPNTEIINLAFRLAFALVFALLSLAFRSFGKFAHHYCADQLRPLIAKELIMC